MKKSHSKIQKPIVIKKTSETCEKKQDGNKIMLKTTKNQHFSLSPSPCRGLAPSTLMSLLKNSKTIRYWWQKGRK